MNRVKKICFIGLGRMGLPIANRLASLQNNFKFHAWNRSQQSIDNFVTLNSNVIGCKTISDAISNADYILTCLPTSSNVLDIVHNAMSEEMHSSKDSKSDCIWIDFTTGDPQISQSISQIFDNQNSNEKIRKQHFMDCPVSGGPKGAKNGSLSCVVGCNSDQIFNQANNDILKYISANVFHVGNVGAGDAIKVMNNLLNVSNLLVLSEGLQCLNEYGIDINIALDVINHSSGRSLASQERYPKQIINDNYFYGFHLGLMKKDIGIALDLIKKYNVEKENSGSAVSKDHFNIPRISSIVNDLLIKANERYGYEADYTEVGKLFIDVHNK